MTLKAKTPISFEGDLTVNFFVIVGDLNIFISGAEEFEPLNFPKFKFPGVCPGRGWRCFELIHKLPGVQDSHSWFSNSLLPTKI